MLFSESHNRGAWRESKSRYPFFRSLLEDLMRRSARLEQQRKSIRGQIMYVGSAMADTAIKGFNSNASCGFVITSYRVVLQPFGEAKTIKIEVFEAAARPRRRDLDFSSAPELIEGELG